MIQDKIFKLKGKVQHYVWGGTELFRIGLALKTQNKTIRRILDGCSSYSFINHNY